MTKFLRQRRSLIVTGVLALLMIQAMMASAATVKTGPYDKATTSTTISNDPVSVPYALGYATATASADVNGSLSASARAYSGILPHGAVISGPVRVNAYDATASAVITQKLLVSGSGPSTIQANFSSIQGATDWSPYNYCNPGANDPKCQAEAYRNATLPRYSYQVYALVVATYYPCQWTTVNPTCSLTARGTKAVNFNGYTLPTSPSAIVNATSSGSGTIVVTASLVTTVAARGGSANVWISGTLSNITLDP